MQIPDALQLLLDDGVIDTVHTRLMAGKEASAFVVERRGELLAAKVYKSREQRTFKATASYVEGRNQTRNSRDKRAMHKRTNYGRELLEQSWRDMEYAALQSAWHAGVRVPEPVLLYEDVLLMQLLVDEEGSPAPRLADFELPADVAVLLHREIYGQVRLLLASGRVHGDLSAFNILIARDGPTLIDLPQVVDAAANNSAAEILQRDLHNVTDHLARFAPQLSSLRDCGVTLWNHFKRGTLDRAIEPEAPPPPRDAPRGPPPPARGFDGPRQEQRRHDGPRHDGPRQDQRRHDGPRHDGPRQEQRRPDGPRQDGPRQDQRRHDGPRHDGPRPEQRRQDGPRPDPRRPDGPRHDGPRPEQRRQDGPRPDGPPRRPPPRPAPVVEKVPTRERPRDG